MFELHITCTKDITKLDLDFADGTSCAVENVKSQSDMDVAIDPLQERKHSEVVEKPKVPEIPNRPVKIDNILNDLQF